jgi:hypothetical protein
MDGVWLRVPALDQHYTRNLSLWAHNKIRAYLLRRKKDVNILSLARTRHFIDGIVANEFALTKRIRGRKIAIRFLKGTGYNQQSISPESVYRVPLVRESLAPTVQGQGGDNGSTSRPIDNATQLLEKRESIDEHTPSPNDVETLDLTGFGGYYAVTEHNNSISRNDSE